MLYYSSGLYYRLIIRNYNLYTILGSQIKMREYKLSHIRVVEFSNNFVVATDI